MSREDTLAQGEFIAAFASLGPMKNTAFSQYVRVATGWEVHNSVYDARTELTAVSLKDDEISQELGTPRTPTSALMLVTQFRKKE